MAHVSHTSISTRPVFFMFALCAVTVTSSACRHEVEPVVEEGPLAQAFRLASAETDVPAELLMAIGWVETRWQPQGEETAADGHDEAEHGPRAIGLMDIPADALEESARLVAASSADVRSDPALNVRAAAQVLRRIALDDDGALPRSLPSGALHGWRDTIARYGAGDDVEVGALYADDVLRVLDTGASGITSTGEQLVLEGRGKSGGVKSEAQQALGDSPYAIAFVPAREGFFTPGRWQAIDRVIIHTTEGSYAGTISWFRSPNNPYQTSAHYVIRSSDGEITQMVREHDTAHHVFNWSSRSIGLEHEAVSAQAHWFTEAMYASSAALVRDICLRYGIPMDRAHIVGHVEVPGNDHTDPGVHWDWGYYMDLVTSGQSLPLPGGGSGGCDGLDYAGVCEGSTLRWCEGGVERSANCAASGQTCGWESDAVGHNCGASAPEPAVDACDGLDYAGACDGSTLRWCESGALRAHDCSNEGQTCGWQDDATGNNCVDVAAAVDPCNGESYAGRCDGATLVWCEDEVVRTFNCASTSQQCGWQDDSVGNNCL